MHHHSSIQLSRNIQICLDISRCIQIYKLVLNPHQLISTTNSPPPNMETSSPADVHQGSIAFRGSIEPQGTGMASFSESWFTVKNGDRFANCWFTGGYHGIILWPNLLHLSISSIQSWERYGKIGYPRSSQVIPGLQAPPPPGCWTYPETHPTPQAWPIWPKGIPRMAFHGCFCFIFFRGSSRSWPTTML